MRLLFVGYDSRLPLSIERRLGYSTLFFGINKIITWYGCVEPGN